MLSTDVAFRQRVCPLCGSSDKSGAFREANFDLEKLDRFAYASRKVPEFMHHRLVLCARCDLLYASPVPAKEALARAYREAGFDSGDEARHASRTYGRLLSTLIRRLPDLSGALDVGTGEGSFLEQLLATGFSGIVGIEPSPEAVAAAAPTVKPLIVTGTFEPGTFPAGQYSLVTCFQTIEHLSDPMETCREMYRLLKPGGALVLVAHNRLALANRVLGLKSPIYDLEHLQLFSPRSARLLLEEAGFAAVQVRSIVNSYPLHYWLRLLPLPRQWKLQLVDRLRGLAVGRLPIALPVGNMAISGFRNE